MASSWNSLLYRFMCLLMISIPFVSVLYSRSFLNSFPGADHNVISDRKSGAQMARLYSVSEATVSKIISQHRQFIEESSLMNIV